MNKEIGEEKMAGEEMGEEVEMGQNGMGETAEMVEEKTEEERQNERERERERQEKGKGKGDRILRDQKCTEKTFLSRAYSWFALPSFPPLSVTYSILQYICFHFMPVIHVNEEWIRSSLQQQMTGRHIQGLLFCERMHSEN